MIESAKVDNLIKKGSGEERLSTVFMPIASRDAIKFFSFMQMHIELQSSEMGISFRESRANIASLLKQEGYDYIICQTFIDDYESQLLKQHYNALDKKKS